MMVLILLLSAIIGQLLKERTSKERILYISTASLFSYTYWMDVIQTFDKIPTAAVLIKLF